MLNWKKKGKIFSPDEHNTPNWMTEYAQLPFPVVLNQHVLRIYFSTRSKKDIDEQYISRNGFIDVLREDFGKVINISHKPIFDLGGRGTFDEFGSMVCSFVNHNDLVYAYYNGWQRMVSVPYTMAIGLAISKDGGDTFHRYSDGPILGITPQEPYLLSGPIVKIIDGKWHMWYLKGNAWVQHNNKYEAVYRLAHATSNDGINWQRDGVEIIPTILENECQVSFAMFFHEQRWNVIFAYRQPVDFRENTNCSYRLGYAWSTDLKIWNRDDTYIDLDVSQTGWDSEMIAYPQVLELNNKIYIFYCGNKFGYEGFGYAELIL